MEDDFERARVLAVSTHRPLFVDVWATWCGPCREMRANVFTSPTMASLRERFVWASINVGNDANKEFLAKYPFEALPTMWVIDPETDAVVLRRETGATEATLHVLLEASDAIVKGGAATDRSSAAARWADALEAAASKAKTPEDRVAFDGERFDAYLALQKPERAVPMLEASERDFPRWFEPPLKLARAHLTMGNLNEATSAIRRARLRAHGWRSLPVCELEADIAKARGDRAAERAALEAALSATAKGKLGPADLERREKVKARLAGL